MPPSIRSGRCAFLLLLILSAAFAAGARAQEVRAWVLLLPNAKAPATIMSTDANERDGLLKGGWKLSGTGLLFTESGPDRGALHRMVRTVDGRVERALEADPALVSKRTAEGFKTEGVLGFALLREIAGAVAVKRYVKGGEAIWVVDAGDEAWARKLGWAPDGIAFRLKPAPAE